MKKIKIIFMIVLGLSLLLNSVSAATVINVDVEPSEPAPASKITITADISSDKEIDKVYIDIQECKEDMCFLNENVSMLKVNNNYEKEYQLTRDEATYFKYSIAIKFKDGSWYSQAEKTDITLKPSSNNNGTNGGNNDSPGFELIIVISAVLIAMLLFKRKRSR